MDLTQIAIGIGLLAVSGVTFAAPADLDATLLTLVAGTALIVGAGVAATSVARDARGR